MSNSKKEAEHAARLWAAYTDGMTERGKQVDRMIEALNNQQNMQELTPIRQREAQERIAKQIREHLEALSVLEKVRMPKWPKLAE